MIAVTPKNVTIFIRLVDFVEVFLVFWDVWADREPIERVHAIACPAPHLSAGYEFAARR